MIKSSLLAPALFLATISREVWATRVLFHLAPELDDGEPTSKKREQDWILRNWDSISDIPVEEFKEIIGDVDPRNGWVPIFDANTLEWYDTFSQSTVWIRDIKNWAVRAPYLPNELNMVSVLNGHFSISLTGDPGEANNMANFLKDMTYLAKRRHSYF